MNAADTSVLFLPSEVTRRHGGDAALLDFSLSTNVFTVGDTVDITFKIKNLGDEWLTNFYCNVNGNGTALIDGVRKAAISNLVCMAGLEDGQSLAFNHLWPRVCISELKVRQCLDMKVQWKVLNEFSTRLQGINFIFSQLSNDIDSRNNRVNWGDFCDCSAAISLVQPRANTDENKRNLRHVSIALGNAGLLSLPAGTTVTFRRGSSQGQVLATKTVGKVLAGEEGTQETGFAWDISSIAPTSNVEVVHVTAELPESAVVEQRTLEAEIPVDVSPIVKSPLTAYSLVYDANGGEGAMAAENPFYDEWRLLTSNAFTRAGYVFAGWALSPTGEVAYADGANHWNVPMFSRDTATLYAVWTRQSEKTATTEVPVPFAWLGAYYPEATNSTDNLEQQIANFEAIAHRATGKYDGAGNPLSVWHDYVAGTNPTNPDDTFKAVITLDKDTNGPVISWTPQLTPEETAKRVYRKYGKVRLDDAEWTLIDNDAENYQFFKVTVEMR